MTVNSQSGSRPTLQSDTWLWDNMSLNWGGSTLQYGMRLWNHDIEFARWQHPALWQVALGWHAIEFAQTSAIFEFYFWFRFRSYHRSWHVILHQCAKFYPNRTTLGRKKWRISAILDFRGPIMGSLKSPRTTSYRSSIEAMALNCLFFEKTGFVFWRQTNEQMDMPDAWSRFKLRRLSKKFQLIEVTLFTSNVHIKNVLKHDWNRV